jgi:hypothetical protein
MGTFGSAQNVGDIVAGGRDGKSGRDSQDGGDKAVFDHADTAIVAEELLDQTQDRLLFTKR